MSPGAIGALGLVALLVLLAARMPVATAMLAVGACGIAAINGPKAAAATLSAEAWTVATHYDLAVIPLFILMGNLAAVSGMSRNLYDAAYAWVGHWRGGLAAATIIGCAGFAAVCGSSVASAVTMGRVALPEMRRFRYDPRLATGTVAAGGTLGILIPPSVAFVIYAVLTEESIGRLFLAGVLPGLLLSGLFVLTITILTWRDATLGPPGPVTSFPARFAALKQALTVVAIVVLTIGGIYGGVFTPVEAAGAGAFLTLAVAFYRRSLSPAAIKQVLLQSVRTSAMGLMIIVGANVFGPFLALTHIPEQLSGLLVGLELGRYGTLAVIVAVYMVLGCFLEGFAMLVLTLPIVLPIIKTLGWDPVWFGVIMVILLEMGMLSPPVGVNVFVIKSIAGDVPMATIFRGIWPFFFAMLLCIVILTAFPQIALVLPNAMIQ